MVLCAITVVIAAVMVWRQWLLSLVIVTFVVSGTGCGSGVVCTSWNIRVDLLGAGYLDNAASMTGELTAAGRTFPSTCPANCQPIAGVFHGISRGCPLPTIW
jgi:hypothetical protein